MKNYLELLEKLLTEGTQKGDRTGNGTLSIFGHQMRFDLAAGFPLITTKKVHLKSIIHELLWFLNGDTNNNLLEEKGVSIWREWSKSDGSLGPVYGKQWRRWEKIELVKPRLFKRPVTKLNPDKVAGVGYGSEERNASDFNRHIYNVWNEMLHRCYDSSRHHYSEYGGRGIFVDSRWHDFSQFLADVGELPNGLLKLTYPNDYKLDKDFFATNKYSKETCIWLTDKEQAINTRRGQVCIATRPDGHEIVTMDVAGLCRDYLLDESTVYKCLRGERTQHKKWTFKYMEIAAGLIPRLRIFDQIQELIVNIKHNPNSRRLVVSAWNVGDIEAMQLPPCHALFQFYVANNKLSCQLYQRSCDTFIGVPFNIASYALLTMMIAQQCDLELGEFVWTGGDVHLYLNHLEQAKTQLQRTPRALPTMKIKRKPASIFDYQYDDFELVGYDADTHISAPIAI